MCLRATDGHCWRLGYGSGEPVRSSAIRSMDWCSAASMAFPWLLERHLFNPAPRIGFAYDVFGNGKTAIRGGYGIFFEHANGNEANTEGMEGQTSPLLQTQSQNNVPGYLEYWKTAEHSHLRSRPASTPFRTRWCGPTCSNGTWMCSTNCRTTP